MAKAKAKQAPQPEAVASPEEVERRRAQQEAWDQRRREECALNEQEFQRRKADVSEAVRRTRPLAIIPCTSIGTDLKRSGFVGQGAIIVTLKPSLPSYSPHEHTFALEFQRDLPIVVPVDPADVDRMAEFHLGQRVALALIPLPPEAPWPKAEPARGEDGAAPCGDDPLLAKKVADVLKAIDTAFSLDTSSGWPKSDAEVDGLLSSVSNLCQGVLNPTRLVGHRADAAVGLVVVALVTMLAPRGLNLSRANLQRRVLAGARERPERTRLVAELLETSGRLLRCADGWTADDVIESSERLAALAFLAEIHFGAADEAPVR